jgi:hypothetical protein
MLSQSLAPISVSQYHAHFFAQTCPAVSVAVCPQAKTFFNRYDAFDTTFSLEQKLDYIMRGLLLKKERNDNRIRNFFYQRALESYLEKSSTTISEEWKKYLLRLVYSASQNNLATENLGACGEAAASAIVPSLIHQLTTGLRENIHQITIISMNGEDNHSAVILNVKKLESSEFSSQKDLLAYLKNLEPENPQQPIQVCDPWRDYSGTPEAWLRSTAGLQEWVNLKILDHTLPSLRVNRDENNVKKRHFLKETALAILKNTFQYDEAEIEQNTELQQNSFTLSR